MRSDHMIEPAFPVHPEAHSRGDAECAALQGMSLRDWFAGRVIHVLLCEEYTPESAARDAYDIADAMLAAREKSAK